MSEPNRKQPASPVGTLLAGVALALVISALACAAVTGVWAWMVYGLWTAAMILIAYAVAASFTRSKT